MLNPEYTFLSSSTDDYDRFVLHFNREATGIEEGLVDQIVKIYSSGKQLFVVNKSDKNAVELSVLNVNGQLVKDYGNISGEYNSLLFDKTPGLYIVRAIAGNSVITTKVLIQ